MKKLLILVMVLAVVAVESTAQLSTRQNLAFDQPLGNRPQAGDAALQFVLPLVDLSANNGSDAGLYSGNLLSSGDFLTFKYYNTNDIVWRGAIRIVADNAMTSGTQADSSEVNNINEDFEIQQLDYKSTSREFNIAGGVEKHFTNNNIFDVYVGGDAIIGLGKDQTKITEDYFNGDLFEQTATTNTNIFGLAGVVGFNVFVAELPVSIGLEYGLSGKWIFGGKTKVKETADFDGGADYEEEWFEQTEDAFGNADSRKYSSLSRRQFNMDTNHNVRLNIHIYFSTLSGNN